MAPRTPRASAAPNYELGKPSAVNSASVAYTAYEPDLGGRGLPSSGL